MTQPQPKGGAFRTRALTALVGIPLGLALVYFDGWALVAAVALLAVLGMHEFCRLTKVVDRRLAVSGYLGAAALIVAAVYLHGRAYYQVGVGLALLVALSQIGVALTRARGERLRMLLRQLAAVTVGWTYVPFLLGFLLQLRGLTTHPFPHRFPPGAAWLALAITTCWAVDTAAFAVGKALGRHKLAPKISPGKTVEGGVAGLLAAVLWCALLGRALELSVGTGLALGVLLGVGAQVGDLFESLLKRRAGVKDSGALLPGHGGVLDRFDSLLFAAPLAYAFLSAVLR